MPYARSEHNFKIQSGHFSYCQISLNTEKNHYLANIFFCKRGGLTQLCSNLGMGVKIVRLIPFYLGVFFRRLTFQSLKCNTMSFSLGENVLQKGKIAIAKAFLGYLQKCHT